MKIPHPAVPPPAPPPVIPVVIVGLLVVALTGCGGEGSSSTFQNAAIASGMADAPPLPPTTADGMCDWSLGSSCTPETFRQLVSAHLSSASTRGGSTFRAWATGRDVGACRVLATVTVPTFSGSERDVDVEREAFIASSIETVMTAMAPVFASARASRSPLAESLTKIATTAPGGPGHRSIVLISDGLQSSFGVADWECLTIEPLATIEARLAAARILEKHSLRGIDVAFAFYDPTVIDRERCPADIGRSLTVTDLWRGLVKNAGGRVTFSPGLPVFGDASTNSTGGAS